MPRRESECDSDTVLSSERVGALFSPLEMTTTGKKKLGLQACKLGMQSHKLGLQTT